MIFSDQFLQYTIKLPSSKIYGLGEHRTNLMLNVNWQRLTMFNHDAVPTENVSIFIKFASLLNLVFCTFQKNLYGSHPFYMLLEPTGNFHGVFLLNSNAMGNIKYGITVESNLYFF